MLTIVHGSDLHFGKRHDPRAAAAFARELEVREADVIVLSGDFTQRAKIREFELARAFIDRFSERPVVVTPGNHDVPLYRIFERLMSPMRNYRRFISSDLNTVTRVQGATVVALDSTAPYRTIVNGRLSRGQLDFAESAFDEAAPGDARVLVTHHNMATPPDYRPEPAMAGTPAILGRLERMGVDVVLSGHLHRAYVSTSLNVFPHRVESHGVLLVHCGTTTSTRGRARETGRNTFNVVEVTEEHLVVDHYMYRRDEDRFEGFARVTLPRTRHGSPDELDRSASTPDNRAAAPADGRPEP